MAVYNNRVSQNLPQTAGKKSVTSMVKSEKIVARFNQVLNNPTKTQQFLAGVVAAVNTNPLLMKADPDSVMASAMVAATLNLDVIPGLGLAALVPYGGKCQFQIMTNGYVQLAMRSGQYKSINVTEIYEDEFESYDPITGEVKLKTVTDGDRDHERQDKIVGYAAYLKFLNGFEHIDYWKISKIKAHGAKYSKSYGNSNGLWQTDFNSMAKKTVLKNCLRKWGILSVEMQKAETEDQKAFSNMDDKNGSYIDNIPEEQVIEEHTIPSSEQKPMTKEEKAQADQDAEIIADEIFGSNGPENFEDGGFENNAEDFGF